MQQHRIPLDNRLFAGFGLIVALLIGSAVISYLNTRKLDEDAILVAHTHEVISTLEGVLISITNAETGQRGFLLTGKPSYLAPYRSAVTSVDIQVAALQELIADNPDQVDRISLLKSAIDKRLQILGEVKRLREEQGFEAAQASVLTHRGKQEMDIVRSRINEMVEAEKSLLEKRSQETDKSYSIALITGIISALLGVLAVGLLFYFVRRSIHDLDRAAVIIYQEREQLDITLKSIGDGVITTDSAGRVTMLNPVAIELTGWSQEDAVGQDLETIFNIVNESTGETVENPALRALEQGTIVGLANHTELVARNGSRRAIADSASPIRSLSGDVRGAVLVFRDVTEDREAENALRSSEALKTAIFSTAMDAMITCDHEGRVIEFNPAAERIFG